VQSFPCGVQLMFLFTVSHEVLERHLTKNDDFGLGLTVMQKENGCGN
jgi:hypothetical protein